jgi:hypothetical protein
MKLKVPFLKLLQYGLVPPVDCILLRSLFMDKLFKPGPLYFIRAPK